MATKTTLTTLGFGIIVILLVVVSDFGLILAQTDVNKDGVNLEEWDAPLALKKAFPYYISGLDHEGQPVFIIEYGKWNIKKYFEEGGDSKTAEIYTDQMMYRWSIAERNLPNHLGGTGYFGLIADFEGYETRQLAHSAALAYTLNMARKFVAASGPGNKLDYGILINMNYVADALINNLVAPILGEVFSKMESSGTNKAKWIPKLLKKIPKESLPTWYGGSEQFKPLAVYG